MHETGAVKLAHRGINQRVAGISGAPCRKPILVVGPDQIVEAGFVGMLYNLRMMDNSIW
jgi:hypothetical protein